MRQIGSFQTDDPKRLDRQLSDLEDNIEHEVDDIRASFVPNFKITPIIKGNGVYSTGIALIADTSVGAYSVLLSNPANKVPGLMLVVNKGAANLTLRPLTPALINAATTVVLGVGMFLLLFDGTNWWSK